MFSKVSGPVPSGTDPSLAGVIGQTPFDLVGSGSDPRFP